MNEVTITNTSLFSMNRFLGASPRNQRSSQETEEGLQYRLMEAGYSGNALRNNKKDDDYEKDELKHEQHCHYNNEDDDELKKKQQTPYWTYQRRRLSQMVLLGTLVCLFLLTASGYHRRRLRQQRIQQSMKYLKNGVVPRTRRERREENKRAKQVLAEIKNMPHEWEDIQKAEAEEERLREIEERQRKVWMELNNMPHELVDVHQAEDKEAKEEEASLLAWMSDRLGQAAEEAGDWVHSNVESVIGNEWTNSVSQTLSSSLDTVGEWVDNTLTPSVEKETGVEGDDDDDEDWDNLSEEDLMTDEEEGEAEDDQEDYTESE